jgi:hypothetical protein
MRFFVRIASDSKRTKLESAPGLEMTSTGADDMDVDTAVSGQPGALPAGKKRFEVSILVFTIQTSQQMVCR